MVKNFIVGEPDAPIATASKFSSKFLKECFVNFIMIDNNTINQLYPNPNFTHSYANGFVDISPNVFETGSKIIFDITPVKPCYT